MSIVKKIQGKRVIYCKESIYVEELFPIELEDVYNFCGVLREESPFEYQRSIGSWEKQLLADAIIFELDSNNNHSRNAIIQDYRRNIFHSLRNWLICQLWKLKKGLL